MSEPCRWRRGEGYGACSDVVWVRKWVKGASSGVLGFAGMVCQPRKSSRMGVKRSTSTPAF